MKELKQILIILCICLAGEAAATLPLRIPSGIFSMAFLFILLSAKVIKVSQIEELSNFMLKNMALFFMPPCVGILKYLDLLGKNFISLFIICFITGPIVLFVAGWTAQLTMRLLSRKEKYGTRSNQRSA